MLTRTLDLPGLQALIDALRDRGRRVIAPTMRDSALELAEITSIDELPRGVGDEQSPGRYRTTTRDDDALFGFAATAQSAKPWLFPPDELLFRATRDGQDRLGAAPVTPVALLGVRSCDLAAIGIHDTVLAGRHAVDVHYAARRADALIVAVTCGVPASTCFCAEMGTGPKPGDGADVVLTEVIDDAGHRFVAEAGTPLGQDVLAGLPGTDADAADWAGVAAVVSTAVASMDRRLPEVDLRELLYASAQSPHWEQVAQRCLACSNCTMVCPTCFCTTIEDVSDLSGDVDARHRVWDSCFSLEYSGMHGGAVRTSVDSRYRQWLTHKLGSWIDQFGMSGCVGCGRCITWCPAGIDLTAEVAALSDLAAGDATSGPLTASGLSQ